MFITESVQYWQKETTKTLSHIFHISSFPNPTAGNYISFLNTRLVPLLGPSPAEFRARNTRPVSFMSDDHTPVEFVWVIGNSSSSTAVHISLEPLNEDGSPLPTQYALTHLKSFGDKLHDFDITWAQACAEGLVLPQGTDPNTAVGTPHSTECFIGVHFTNDHLVGRAYFYPALRAKSLNVSMEFLISKSMHHLGVGRVWSRIISYINTMPPHHRPSAETVGVDCLPPSRNRVKVYLYTQLCSLSGILDVISLGGQLRDESAMIFGATLTRLWNLLWSGVHPDQPLTMKGSRRYPNGFLMYFEMHVNKADPVPKIYLPVRHFCDSDAHIADAICSFYKSLGKEYAAEKYMEHVKQSITYRDPSKRTGFQPYLGFCVKKGAPEISHYFSPESFAPERLI